MAVMFGSIRLRTLAIYDSLTVHVIQPIHTNTACTKSQNNFPGVDVCPAPNIAT